MAKNNNLTDFLTGVADAIRAKKGTSSPINPQDFESEIENIQTGVDTADATATAADIRVGKTAYVNEEKVEGSIQDYNGEIDPASGKSLFAQRADQSLTEVTAGDLAGITQIGDHAFCWSDLVSITIPGSIISIGSKAFNSCRKLKSIIISEGVTRISDQAFGYCENLETITIPDSVTSIDIYVCISCINLMTVTIGKGVIRIPDNAFQNCGKLSSVVISDNAKYINSYAFYYCRSLTNITIPNSMLIIRAYAFGSCTTLSSVKMLPKTPPILEPNAFNNTASNLQIIVPKGTLDAYKTATNWSAYADKMVEADE